MNVELIYSIAIVGGGAAGVMAVNRTLLNNDSCIFFSGNPKDKKRSRALWVKKVENIPGLLQYNKGITNPNDEMLTWLKTTPFAANFSHFSKSIVRIDWNPNGQTFDLFDEENNLYRSRYVVLCTGMMDVQPIINGSIKPILPYANTQQANYCLRCDGHLVLGKHTAVIGNTRSCAHVAISLFEKYAPPSVNIFTNGEHIAFSQEELQLLGKYGIHIHGEKIVGFKDDENKKLNAVRFEGEKEVSTQMIFIALGVIVYNQLAKSLGANLDERGFVLTDEFGQSSVDKLYIAGDLKAGKKKQIYSAWDGAVDAIEHINGRIRTERRMKKL